MGLLNFIFGNKKQPKVNLSDYFASLNGYSPVYTSYDGGLYELSLCRAVVHRIATECSKARPTLAKPNSELEYIVKRRPNPYMTASQFYYRLATIYEIENNAFIVPIEDVTGKTIGLFPVCPSQVELVEKKGTVYVIYTFANGEKKAIEYTKCAHLRKMQYKDDFFGETNDAFKSIAGLVKADENSTNEAITNGSNLRFKGKLNQQILDEEDFKEQQKAISTLNLNGNKTGVFLYDSRFESMEEIKHQAMLLDAEQKKAIENSVFTYWGISEEILQNTYDEDVWNAFYESHISPFYMQAGECLTFMIYTEYQTRNGNEVSFTSNRLDYASNKTKMEFVNYYFDRGLITKNQALQMLNLPQVEDGDKCFIRAEYINLDNVGKGVTDDANGNSDKVNGNPLPNTDGQQTDG